MARTRTTSEDPQPPLLDPRTGLVVTGAVGAGLAAAFSNTWATGITTAIAVLLALQQVVGRWRR
ncbi:hypothetical protein [Catellatospora sp. NPDC049609]|uniref:hypothetical protein n=1 Tax=Catellatospora sp. NPDC049609 TaxID=3155505 RepID=UPI00341CE857